MASTLNRPQPEQHSSTDTLTPQSHYLNPVKDSDSALKRQKSIENIAHQLEGASIQDTSSSPRMEDRNLQQLKSAQASPAISRSSSYGSVVSEMDHPEFLRAWGFHNPHDAHKISHYLLPIHAQLCTLKRCLLQVQELGGPFKPMELYPYQIKLSHIDNKRKDGVFYDEQGAIPEGQGVVNDILSECYDIMQELKAELVD